MLTLQAGLGPVVEDAHAGHRLAGVAADAHHKHVRALALPLHGQLSKHRAHLRARGRPPLMRRRLTCSLSARQERRQARAAAAPAILAGRRRAALRRGRGRRTLPCCAAPPIQNLLAVLVGVWMTNSPAASSYSACGRARARHTGRGMPQPGGTAFLSCCCYPCSGPAIVRWNTCAAFLCAALRARPPSVWGAL